MKKIILIASIAACILSGCVSKETVNTEYVVAIGEEPETVTEISDVDVLVIDAEYYSPEDIDKLKSNNVNEIYSYLNIGSIEEFRDCYEEFEPYALGEYENWPDERWMDVSNAKWQEFMDYRMDELSQKGIDGFFVDNIDVYYLYPTDEIYQGIVHILSHMKESGKKVIINGGDSFVKQSMESGVDLDSLFDGINQESVYTKYDFEGKEYNRNSEEEIIYYTEYLDMLVKRGYRVYALEYAVDSEIINEAYDYSRKHDYICYVADNIELKLD